MADNEDVNALRRRGRRRLIGAIALVLAAVIVLPMVFDAEPRQSPPLSVRIPGEDESVFRPKAAPKEPAESALATASAPEAKPAANPDPVPSPKPESPPAPEPTVPPKPPTKAEPASAAAATFVVQIGAFRESEKAKEVAGKLAAAKMPHYTEPVAIAAGTATRVRVGPYPNRQAAEQALKRVQELGFKGARIVEQSS